MDNQPSYYEPVAKILADKSLNDLTDAEACEISDLYMKFLMDAGAVTPSETANYYVIAPGVPKLSESEWDLMMELMEGYNLKASTSPIPIITNPDSDECTVQAHRIADALQHHLHYKHILEPAPVKKNFYAPPMKKFITIFLVIGLFTFGLLLSAAQISPLTVALATLVTCAVSYFLAVDSKVTEDRKLLDKVQVYRLKRPTT